MIAVHISETRISIQATHVGLQAGVHASTQPPRLGYGKDKPFTTHTPLVVVS
jgi:hypothetical protein